MPRYREKSTWEYVRKYPIVHDDMLPACLHKYSNIRRMKFYTEPSLFIWITYRKHYFAITNRDCSWRMESCKKSHCIQEFKALTNKLVLLYHMYCFSLRIMTKTSLTEINEKLYSKEPTDYEKLSLLVENLINYSS